MKTLSYTLCAVLAAGFAFTGDAQVKPKSKKVTELKFSGRIQAQWDGIESDGTTKEDRNHFYFQIPGESLRPCGKYFQGNRIYGHQPGC